VDTQQNQKHEIGRIKEKTMVEFADVVKAAKGASVKLSYGDKDLQGEIFSESFFVFEKCVSKFDPDKGYKFHSYFIHALYNHAKNMYRKRQYYADHELPEYVSVKSESSYDKARYQPEESDTVYVGKPESLLDDTDIESLVFLAGDIVRLSDDARYIINIALNTPKEIVDYTRYTGNARITINTIFKHLYINENWSQPRFYKAVAEIKSIMN
jgi:hypothetical protein